MAYLERGIHELYAEDPERADALVWGRSSRRAFLKKGMISLMGMAVGAPVVFSRNMPAGFIPAALQHSDEAFTIKGKHPELRILNDRPWNAETPPHLLDDLVTPADRLFVRNNGLVPENIDPATWKLTIGGESILQSKSYSIQDLKRQFNTYRYQLTLECGGNGRAEFNPPAKGNQWTTGAVGAPVWTGVRLKDVLQNCGIKEDAVYIAYYGRDRHLSGDPNKVVISRGVPIAKALEDESLIAWAINDQDIPLMNGYPLRLIMGGWPGSVSGKWLARIDVRNKVHDGPKMTGYSYRVPKFPVAPGSKVKEEDMKIIESMPVKSLITYPKSGGKISLGRSLTVRGKAWAGDFAVKKVELSIDFGASWQNANLKAAANRLAWQAFDGSLQFPMKGYYEVWARATDEHGSMQPMVLPGWNPKGYLNNACHRIAIKVI